MAKTEITLGLENWKRDMGRFFGTLSSLSRKLSAQPGHIQDEAAKVIADMYRAFLHEGVEPELHPITKFLTGDHPPLSTLADHVIVIKSGARGEGRPAVVTFEEDFTKVAFLLDHGYAVLVDQEKVHNMIGLALAMSDTGKVSEFLDEGMGGLGIWDVPPRPHIHYLQNSNMAKVIVLVATAVIKGWNIPNFETPPIPWTETGLRGEKYVRPELVSLLPDGTLDTTEL